MKPEWKEFLLKRGAEIDNGCVKHFGAAVREQKIATTGEVLCDLSHFGLISVRGEDAESFLQGQLTNDIRQVNEGRGQLNAYCNPKGRMLAVFWVLKRHDSYLLMLPRTLLEQVMKRLKMFVLMAKVTIEDASLSLVRIGYSGPKSTEELVDVLGAAPEKDYECLNQDGVCSLRIPGVHARYIVVGELDAIQQLWTTLDVRGVPIGASGWQLLDIRAGIPVVHEQTMEAFVPQMANLQLVEGVSFKKGCYTGQEIVARMQYLGKLKRRMYLAHVDGSEPPQPGDELFSSASASGQGAGKVVDAVAAPDGGFDLLAVIEIASLENGEIHLGQDGPVLEVHDLPYEFDAVEREQNA